MSAGSPKVLIITSFPAPYRTELFDLIGEQIDLTVIYERNSDASHPRSHEWYGKISGPNSHLLGPPSTARPAAARKPRLRDFDFVIFYEYASIRAARMILECQLHNISYAINCDGGFVNHHLLRTPIKRLLISNASLCFAGSNSAADYFGAYGARSSQIARHHFTNLTEQALARLRPRPLSRERAKADLGLDHRPVVLCVAQFIARKGIDVLLHSWTHIAADASLVIVGGGPEESTYRGMIDDLNLTRVHIHPFANRDQLTTYYHAADLFVLPTREDVWGLVVNEAMAAGLPVITTDRCNAGIELIANEGGEIVIVGDHNALGASISRFISDRSLRAATGYRNASRISSYTLEAVANSHVKEISTALTKSGD